MFTLFITIFLTKWVPESFESIPDDTSGRHIDQNPVFTSLRSLFAPLNDKCLYYLKSKNHTYFPAFSVKFLYYINMKSKFIHSLDFI